MLCKSHLLMQHLCCFEYHCLASSTLSIGLLVA